MFLSGKIIIDFICFPIFELKILGINTLHLEACNVSSAFHKMLQILANLCHPDGLWRNYNFRFTHLLQLGTSDHCQMGDVFINLRALMLCLVIFEYLNQKRKVIRRMPGYYLEYFFMHRLWSGDAGWGDVGISQSRFWNNRMAPLWTRNAGNLWADRDSNNCSPSFLFTPCSSAGWGEKLE